MISYVRLEKTTVEVRDLDVETIKQKALTLSKALEDDNVIEVFDKVMSEKMTAPDYMVITQLADLYHQIRMGHLSRSEGVLQQRELISEWDRAIK